MKNFKSMVDETTMSNLVEHCLVVDPIKFESETVRVVDDLLAKNIYINQLEIYMYILPTIIKKGFVFQVTDDLIYAITQIINAYEDLYNERLLAIGE